MELATELQRQAESKKDYSADTRAIRFEVAESSRTPGSSSCPELFRTVVGPEAITVCHPLHSGS
jgi:hypothetical protein